LARGGSYAETGLSADVGGCTHAPRLSQDGVTLGEGGPPTLSGDPRRSPALPAHRDREAPWPAHVRRRDQGPDRMTRSPVPRAVRGLLRRALPHSSSKSLPRQEVTT